MAVNMDVSDAFCMASIALSGFSIAMALRIRKRLKKLPRGDIVPFRMFHMPCCDMLICWVNHRIPNNCPECGERVFKELKLKSELTVVNDPVAVLYIHDEFYNTMKKDAKV